MSAKQNGSLVRSEAFVLFSNDCENEELEHDLENGNLAHAMMLERMQGALHGNPGSRCCLLAPRVFCEPPRAVAAERCKTRCVVKQDLGGADYKVCKSYC